MKIRSIKYIDYLVALVSYFFLSFLVLGGFIFSEGTIGFFHDWFLGPFEEMNQSWAKNGPYAWDSQVGYKFYYTDWIFRLILSFLPSTFMSGEILTKALLVIVVTFSGFGAFSLGKRLKLCPYVSFGVGIMYVFSPIIFTRIIAGHMYYLMSYFLSPLIVASFLKGKEENRNKYFIIAAILLSLAVIQIQFLVMIMLILLVFSLIDIARIKRAAVGLVIVFFITILIAFSPLFLAQLFSAKSPMAFNTTQLLSYRALTTASGLAESFRILGYEVQPYSYLRLDDMGTIPVWIFYLDYLLPIVGFSTLFFRRDKYTISFALISIIGLFLLKGTNPPFPSVFLFLFTHGLYIFRELWHVVFLYSFSITFLAAFFIERLTLFRLKPVKITLVVALISLIAISNGYPLLLGNFAGYLQTYDLPAEYHTLYNKLLSNPNYNVLILPYINPIRYDNLRLQGLDPMITNTPSMIFPAFLQDSKSAMVGASTWLLSLMLENKTDSLGKLLSGFGIKYVILRSDFVSNYPQFAPSSTLSGLGEKWYNSLEPLLDSQKDLKIISNTGQYRIYENMNNATKVFAPRVSAGGLTNFDSLLWISNLTSLSNVAVYPSASNNYSVNFVDTREESNLSGTDFIDLGRYASTFNADNGWTTNRDAFGYDHLLGSRVSSGIFTKDRDSKLSFELPSKYNNKPIEIWLKALAWNQGGLTEIQINGKDYPISLVSPRSEIQMFKLFKGESKNPHEIMIKNVHGNNYLEGLYIRDRTIQNLTKTDEIAINNSTYQKENNLIKNPSFSAGLNASGLPLQWNDKLNTCRQLFSCKITPDGWDDNSTLQLSTKKPHNLNISGSIYGRQIDVEPNERYEIVAHMKLNRWATLSHAALEGFNQSSNTWREIIQCPSGTNGPLDWTTMICQVTIPDNFTKIDLVLKAGHSSQKDKIARTWFDSLSISKIGDENQSSAISQLNQSILPIITQNNSFSTKVLEYNKVNPTLWNLRISTAKPATIAFAEPFDQRWEATIYKDGNKVDVVKSMPLYGSINSFEIKQTGNLNVVLDFAPQHWYYIGFIISGLTFAFCVFYLIYDWISNRGNKTPLASVPNHD